MLEIPQRIWKKIPGYSKPSKVFRTNHENVLCWKTNRKEDRKPVVIKLFERDIIEESAAEIKAAQSIHVINHSNLIKILEVGEDDDIGVYYVMECWGKDLRDTIQIKPDPKIALEIIRQVLEGLAELHKKVGAHRDIKPENIFLKGNQVKIGDYGLVKSQRYVTQLTTIAGTRDYMAPEVLDGKPYDHRCDIYSTGVVLRELLTGEQPPFTGDAANEICSKAMAPEPKDRFQTAEEFIKALTPTKGLKNGRTEEPTINAGSSPSVSPSLRSSVSNSPIFQKLDIQRYPPKPEMRGQDTPGVTIETLKPQLDALLKQGDYESALKVGTEYVKAVKKRFGEHNSRTPDAIDILAGIFIKLKNYREASIHYAESLELDKKIYGSPSRQYIMSLYHLAQERLEAGDYPASKDYYTQALSLVIQGYNEEAIIRNNLAGILYLLKEYYKAITLYQEAITINEKAGKISEALVINLYNLALTYEAIGNHGTAQPFYKQAKDTLAKLPPDKLTLSDKERKQIEQINTER
ncbi:MAG: serine/threonine protein kinase [Planctomycetes bacterium]|nr:serine/threonine protein kinase [Planctomycetota bacterium]